MIIEKKLIKPEFFEELRLYAQDIMGEDRFREAYDLSKLLSTSLDNIKDFKAKNYNLYIEYQRIINQLSWVGLPIMTEEMVVNMFQHSFTSVFEVPGYDIRSKLKAVLLGIVVLDDRDKFKKQLRDALMKNEEKITSQRLIIDDLKKDPTVSNWLTDYNKILGTGPVEGLARTEYLVNSKNIKNLEEKDKQRVRFLFDLYERLKLSSQTFEGLENEIPLDEKEAVGVIKEGIFEPFAVTDKQKQTWQMIEDFLRERRGESGGKKLNINGTSNDLVELKNLAVKYQPGSLEKKVIEEEIKRREENKN